MTLPLVAAAVAVLGSGLLGQSACFDSTASNGEIPDGGRGGDSGSEYRSYVVPLQTLPFTMTQPPVVGQSFVLQLPAAGGTPPYTWSVVSGSFPAGVSLDPDGRVVGTPSEQGSYEQVLRLTDATGTSVTANYHMSMATAGSLDLTLIPPAFGAFGQDREVGFIPAVQGPGESLPWTFTLTGLPDGVTFDPASGLLSGVPTVSGTSQVTLELRDQAGTHATGSPTSAPLQIIAPVPAGSGTDDYDGTYDWFLGPVGGITADCSACVFITNGVLSNSEGSFSNSSIDHFGNLTFDGPCPNGSPATGRYSGYLGGLSRAQWQGTWTCDDGSVGGADSPWKIFNQQ